MQGAQASSEHPPHRKIDVTSKPPVGGISVVTLIRTDTTLDHSQKAEKVYHRDIKFWKGFIYSVLEFACEVTGQSMFTSSSEPVIQPQLAGQQVDAWSE